MATTRKAVTTARKLRATMSLPEVKLWQLLRQGPNGIKFRRQHPIGRYVADFYIPAAKLVIEIDGIAHDMGDRPERDEMRDAWLQQQGYRVIRIPATEVLGDVDAVADALVRMIEAYR